MDENAAKEARVAKETQEIKDLEQQLLDLELEQEQATVAPRIGISPATR